MKYWRLIVALPFLVPVLVGFVLVVLGGIPFGVIGGKPAFKILDGMFDFLRS